MGPVNAQVNTSVKRVVATKGEVAAHQGGPCEKTRGRDHKGGLDQKGGLCKKTRGRDHKGGLDQNGGLCKKDHEVCEEEKVQGT